MVRTILSLVFVVSFWSSAEATVLCARKDAAGNPRGNVTLREACKSKEIQLDPVTLGVQGPAVYDATGKKVGDITDLDTGTAAVLFQLNQYRLLLYVISDGNFFYSGNIYLFFESSDCTGTPLVPSQAPNRFVPSVTIADPGQTLYIADPQGLPQFVNYHSTIIPGGPCTTTNNGATLVPALALGDLSTLFTPPFSVR